MKAVVLAAGMSTRLYPLTLNRPKCMVLVNGKPMLHHVIGWLRNNGLTDLIITLHYLPDKIVDYFGDGHQFGVSIRYEYEDELLDTAGSLKRCEQLLQEDFLVLSGSYLLPALDFSLLMIDHKRYGGIGTIVGKRINEQELLKDFGQLLCTDRGKLRDFREKPPIVLSNVVHTTYQLYSPKIFQFIPDGVTYSIPSDLIPQLLINGQELYVHQLAGRDLLIAVSTMHMLKMAEAQMQSLKRFKLLND